MMQRAIARPPRSLALAAGLLWALGCVPGAALAAPANPAPVTTSEAALQHVLASGLEAFNRGDFAAYLRDFDDHVSYNGLPLNKPRLIEINQELAMSFPAVRMHYRQIRIVPTGPDEATVGTLSEFDGHTANYDNSGLPATYHEEGVLTALYHRQGSEWKTGTLQVSSNESFIDIGRPFGLIGFSDLPTLVGTAQPYTLRCFVGNDNTPGATVAYAYALVPLRDVIEKEGAERVFAHLTFQTVGVDGVKLPLQAPAERGTFAHVLVVNKFVHRGEAEIPIGQKVYTRLVRVD